MAQKKTDVFDYLKWRGDLTFGQSELNEVDGLILAILSYLDFSCAKGTEEIVFSQAVEEIQNLPDEVKYNGAVMLMHKSVELAIQAAATRRFGDMKVRGYMDVVDEAEEVQFSAVTFILSDGTAFVAFRGTDNTLVGWKEDFNMSFTSGVPAQLKAADYVRDLLATTDYEIRMSGHSKGGNLAIWAGAHQDPTDKKRILHIYNNDGPGFSRDFVDSENYQAIQERISSFVPESSIVGVLMEQVGFTTIQSTNPVVLQHDPFSWVVEGPAFVYDEKRSKSVSQAERVIDAWLNAMSPAERESFVDGMYDIIVSSNAKKLEDIDNNKLKSLFHMQKTFWEMGSEKRRQLISSFGKIILNNETMLKIEELVKGEW